MVILEVAAKLGIKVEITDVGLYDLYTADEVMCSGTMAELCPVVKVDGRVIGTGKPGEVYKQLLKGFQEETQTTGAEY